MSLREMKLFAKVTQLGRGQVKTQTQVPGTKAGVLTTQYKVVRCCTREKALAPPYRRRNRGSERSLLVHFLGSYCKYTYISKRKKFQPGSSWLSGLHYKAQP